MRLHKHADLGVERILEQLEREGVGEQFIEPFAERAIQRAATRLHALFNLRQHPARQTLVVCR